MNGPAILLMADVIIGLGIDLPIGGQSISSSLTDVFSDLME